MNRIIKTVCIFVLLGCSIPSLAGETITVNGRGDATQSGLLIEADNARAVVMLFPGGGGFIKLKDDGTFRKAKGNFLIRSKEHFLENNLHVVIMDSPSDYQNRQGMRYGFRSSDEHMKDVGSMVENLKQRFNLPVWLVGTSRGTESVGNAMVKLNTKIDGAVLTASITELNDKGSSVLEFDLEKVTIPVMVTTHSEDECWVTPPDGAQRIGKALTASSRVKVKMYSGGDEPVADVCRGKSAHGFYGLEKEAADDIAAFITSS